MKTSSRRHFVFRLALDAFGFIALYFSFALARILGGTVSLGTILLYLWATRVLGRSASKLTIRQEEIILWVEGGWVLILVAAILAWAFRVHTGGAWGLASLGIMVLGAIFYGSWDQLNGKRKQAKSASKSPTTTS
jgi:hypothetical protein